MFFFRCIFRRLLGSVPVFLLAATAIFGMLHGVPGSPFDGERELPLPVAQSMQSHYGTDQSLSRQYLRYMAHICRGNLGPSFRHPGWSVNELIGDKMAISFELGTESLLLAMALGIGWGCWAALHPNSWICRWNRCTMVGLLCVPTFVLGPILNDIFVHRLHWFGAMGWQGWHSKVLPVITLALGQLAAIGLLTQRAMEGQMSQLYVRTAKAKGLRPFQVFFRHIFRNGIQPIIAYLGPTCATVLSGTFIVENIFHVPGLGCLFIDSITNRDYTVVSGIVLLYAGLIILCNLIADIALALINPRIRSF
jgi:oligopeptide transport system permease protein